MTDEPNTRPTPAERPVPQVREALKSYISDWARIIYDACGDQTKVDRAIQLADLNSMFDPAKFALTARPSNAPVAVALAWLPIETAPEHVQQFARNCMTGRNDYIEFCGTLVDGRPFVLCLKEPYGKEYDRWLPLPRVETKGDAVLSLDNSLVKAVAWNRRKSALPAWQCAGRKQSLPEPGECDWPICGCDPYAAKVIEALEESGALAASLIAKGEGK